MIWKVIIVVCLIITAINTLSIHSHNKSLSSIANIVDSFGRVVFGKDWERK